MFEGQGFEVQAVGGIVVGHCDVTDPASIAWLLNIRGADVPYTPFALGFAILRADGLTDLFMAPEKLPEKPPEKPKERPTETKPSQEAAKAEPPKPLPAAAPPREAPKTTGAAPPPAATVAPDGCC